MEAKYNQMLSIMREISDLNGASCVLYWDQMTYMPSGGSSSRARQRALLDKLSHERLISDELGELLEELRPYEEQCGYDSDEAGMIRRARRKRDVEVCFPTEFVVRMTEHSSASYNAWVKARPENDFKAVVPYLKTTLAMSREAASFFPKAEHIADPLIDLHDEGFTAGMVSELFENLRKELVPVVNAICDQTPLDDSCMRKHYPAQEQIDFGGAIVRQMGYDYDRGRHDLTAHPFMIKFSQGDVRITYRVQEHDFAESFYSFLHEAGHAMYEQGINPAYDGLPLSRGLSSGMHESQSRLWENLVGRSQAYCDYLYPKLKEAFPSQMEGVTVEDVYRAINKVERSLIRTNADEVTYNLHVLIRFSLAMDMLEGKLDPADLADEWRTRYTRDLGITPPDDKNGAMQDVHWYFGMIGNSFQGYTLGNIMNAQIFEAAKKDMPGVYDDIAKGEFTPLRNWLTDKIYRHGSKYKPAELIKQITGGPISVDAYMRYIKSKFGELYSL